MAYTTIDKSSDYFNTKLYSGNSTDNTAITGVGFQPDLVWIRNRSVTENHQWQDVVRGQSGGKYYFIQANQLAGNQVQSDNDGVKSLDSDGFTLGYTNSTGWNQSGSNYASWNWLAANGTSANSDGSISSTVSATTTAGFSIVKYAGAGTNNDTTTVGHGLGAAPNFISVKCINTTGGWQTSSTSLGWNNVLRLENNSAQASGTYAFGVSGVTPSSTTFTVSASSGDNHTNTSGNDYVAYCFTEIKGYSKFGSYTGTAAALPNTPFVYTGFKPALVIIKKSGGTANWIMFDNKRPGYNPIPFALFPNKSEAEVNDGAYYGLDLLSNGFKIANTASYGDEYNANTTYIYMAFAENPFVTSTGIPGLAG